MIKHLIFDFGKVLVECSTDSLLKDLIPDDPEERRQFSELVNSPEFLEVFDLGELSFDEMASAFSIEYPRWSGLFKPFLDRQVEVVKREVPGMREILHSLKSQGYGLYGLTNWGIIVKEHIRRFETLRILDGSVISSEEHIIKPDREIFDRLCRKFSLSPAECLFTDDKQANVDAALAYGMDAVLFTDADQFESDLLSRGITCSFTPNDSTASLKSAGTPSSVTMASISSSDAI